MLHCHKFITPPNFLTRIPKMMVWKRWLLLNMAMLVSTVYIYIHIYVELLGGTPWIFQKTPPILTHPQDHQSFKTWWQNMTNDLWVHHYILGLNKQKHHFQIFKPLLREMFFKSPLFARVTSSWKKIVGFLWKKGLVQRHILPQTKHGLFVHMLRPIQTEMLHVGKTIDGRNPAPVDSYSSSH